MNAGLARYAAQQTKLRDGYGRELGGYFDDSAGNVAGAVVVVHDFFGLTPAIRAVCSRIAAKGFVTFAPDLYRGRVASTRDQAASLASGIAWNQVAVELGLGVSALKDRRAGTRVAVLGFAMGGAAAVVAAASVSQLDAAVTFYGIPQDVTVDNRNLRLLGHFASEDLKCTAARVTAFSESLAARGVPAEIHRYDAPSGFCHGSAPEVQAPVQADSAWARTLQFLAETLA